MSVVGEAALAAFFEVLFGKFSSTEFGFVTEKQVRKEIVKWETLLRNIHALLADAEERQLKDKAVKIWLSDLRDLAYDVDDVLDEFATEALGRKLRKEHQASTSTAQKLIPTFSTGLHPGSIMFNHKMVSQIKEITGRLEDLTTRMSTLKLTDNYGGRPMAAQNRPRSSQSTSLVNEADIYGRREDKEKLLNLIVRNDHGTETGFSVIPIVGMGGIGKTTLAQLVYNESKGHFDIHAWACVSEEFDIIKVTKTILQSVTPQPCDSNDLNSLQVRLKEKLSEKKFLIVLDDVWNESYEDWTKLRSPFVAGAPGSKIIVTTRSFVVSSIMKTIPDHFSVQKLMEDDSVSMLAHHALGSRDFCARQDLKEIGLGIVKKCDGLPLATKTIGGLLRNQMDCKIWKDILESEIWSLSEKDNAILPALQLSYYHLSSQLKQCFAYCSLIPKDYEFTEQEIVLLWMAEGFLNDANTKKEIEDSGKKCFKELISRSFFQESSMKKSHFVMHDLINDLARSIAGKAFFRMEGDYQKEFSKEIRHSSYIRDKYDGIKKFKTFFGAERLRTFLSFENMKRDYKNMNRYYMNKCYISNDVVTHLLPKLRYLRVLSLNGYGITEIPSLVGDLKHLRYLDFSNNAIPSLPDSICTLYNLEALLLRYCWKIEKLPSKIGILVNLCHLDITGANSIKEMPSGIGELRNLQTLSIFIVGRDGGLDIRDMQKLSNLRGELSISNLQNVDEAQYACEAKLSSKADLDSLKLQWCDDFSENLRKKEVEREVLSLLQTHNDLKALTIKYYAGTLFPAWIGDPSLKNLWSLKLKDCPNCSLLPTVGKLPLLKNLYIKGMRSVICVGNEFYGENWQNVFPSLETLHFDDMPEWKEWKACEGKKFPRLQELYIINCPKLVGTFLNGLQSLEKLRIRGCQELAVYISNLPMLHELEIDVCKEVVFGSSTNLYSVKTILVENIPKFGCVREDLRFDGSEELASTWQTNWGLGSLRSLRTLHFKNCQYGVSVGAASKEEETGGLLQLEIPCNIEDVRIRYFEELEKLSKTFSNHMCLKVLRIEECPKLVSISVDTLPPTLRTLGISWCHNLQCLLDDRENIDFNGTSLLESLDVFSCKGLKSLSASDKLPAALKSLRIHNCPSLEVIAAEFGGNTSLEEIHLSGCENIKYLPQGLDKLNRLQRFWVVDCRNLTCFPERGLPVTPNLKSMVLIRCEKLEALPSLDSLQLKELYISGCPRLVKSIPEGGLRFPATLLSLSMEEPNIAKAVMERGGLHTLTSLKRLTIKAVMEPEGLHTLTSLTELTIMAVMEPVRLHTLTSVTRLTIDGSDYTDTVSFLESPNMKLPFSLIHLEMRNFKNLRKLSSHGFQSLTSLQSFSIHDCPELKSLPKNLTSLRYLLIRDCPKLKSLPKKEMLLSLLELYICRCPELEKRCRRDKGKLWSNISHIPCVEFEMHRFL